MNATAKNVRSGTDPDHLTDGLIPLHGDSPESSAASAAGTILNILVELQHKYGAFGKDGTGHGYKYVSLGHMLDQMRDDLYARQVLVVHSSAIHENVFTLTTRLVHIPSETEMSTQYAVPFAEQKANSNAQVTGGYETYGRRYNLIKLLNCSTEDNDAADVFRSAMDRLSKAENREELRNIMHDSKTLKMTAPKVWEELIAHHKECQEKIEKKEGDDADPGS